MSIYEIKNEQELYAFCSFFMLQNRWVFGFPGDYLLLKSRIIVLKEEYSCYKYVEKLSYL